MSDRSAMEDPRSYRDRSEDWLELWHGRRRAEIRALVTPELVEEHRRDPVGVHGRHSHELTQVLNYLRSRPSPGKEFIYPERPFAAYRIGILSRRYEPLRFHDDRRFATTEEAAHAIFMLRLAEIGVDVSTWEGAAA